MNSFCDKNAGLHKIQDKHSNANENKGQAHDSSQTEYSQLNSHSPSDVGQSNRDESAKAIDQVNKLKLQDKAYNMRYVERKIIIEKEQREKQQQSTTICTFFWRESKHKFEMSEW